MFIRSGQGRKYLRVLLSSVSIWITFVPISFAQEANEAVRERRSELLREYESADSARRRSILREWNRMRLEESSSSRASSPDSIASWFEPLAVSGALGLGAELGNDGRLTRREVRELVDWAREDGLTEEERESLREVAEVYGEVMATSSHKDLVKAFREETDGVRVYGVEVRDDAASYVADGLESLTAAERRRAHRHLRLSARTDGNRIISLEEAKNVLGPLLGGEETDRALRARLDSEVARESRVREGVDVVFNSNGAGTIRDRIIETLRNLILEADGRRLDVNIMLFSFTDPAIAEEILRLVEAHENLHVRLLTDWSQLSDSGSHKAPVLVREARERGLDRLEVKYKKDSPYVWSDRANRPVYSHRHSRGLNHHKGFVALIEGRPVKLLSGSYNWSPTAESKNFENIVVIDDVNSSSRGVLSAYESEFESFWNDGRVALTDSEAREHKRRLFDEMRREHEGESVDVRGLESGRGGRLNLLDEGGMVDVNGVRAESGLVDVLGDSRVSRRVAGEILDDRLRWGRFDSMEDLVTRVPMVSTLSESDRKELEDSLFFGDGLLAVNSASESDLKAVGFSRSDARSLIAYRADHGDFESLSDLREVPGISSTDYYRARRVLTAEVDRVAFSARGPHEEVADTGYAPENEAATIPLRQPDGSVVDVPATLGSGALDMIRSADSGETLELATYGLSSSTLEYRELVEAARRGVHVKVILNPAYNGGVAAALDALRTDEGLENIEVRFCKKKTMHEKFMVYAEGEDVFNGSANLSGSSSSRHSEDRFFFKNDPSLVKAFRGEFSRLWAISVRP